MIDCATNKTLTGKLIDLLDIFVSLLLSFVCNFDASITNKNGAFRKRDKFF